MPRKAHVVIYDGDDFERLSELRRKVRIAEAKAEDSDGSPGRLGDDTNHAEAIDDAKAEYRAFVDEAAERADEWILEPIGHEEWRRLLAEHPPRKVPGQEGEPEATHSEDQVYSVNTETFWTALLNFRRTDADGDVWRTVVEPDLGPDELRKRIKRLARGEFNDLAAAAYLLNEGGIGDPKASMDYETAPPSSETSASPSRLG